MRREIHSAPIKKEESERNKVLSRVYKFACHNKEMGHFCTTSKCRRMSTATKMTSVCRAVAVVSSLMLFVQLVAVNCASPYNRIQYAGEHIHVGPLGSTSGGSSKLHRRQQQHQQQQWNQPADVLTTTSGSRIASGPNAVVNSQQQTRVADCPVEPPCFCISGRTISSPEFTRHSGSTSSNDVNGGHHTSVVSQRIACGVFGMTSLSTSAIGSRRGKNAYKVADAGVTSSTRRFPRFVESNDAVERHVSLSYSGLTTIPGTAFHALKVVELDLQGNDFADRISSKAFVGVGRRLLSLNLAWSNITRLSVKLFRGLSSLRNLSLAENRLRRLPHQLFDDLVILERLSLAGNSDLNELPGDLFRNQGSSLQFLDLGYCALRKLPWKLFGGLASLRHLDIRGNGLENVEPFTFADLRSLQALLLSHNPLTRLPSRIFYGLANLTVLRVDESSIERIDNDVFRDTRRIETLDLGDNRLTSIQPGTLLIPALRQVALDGNRLVEIPPDVAYLPSLRHLDVSYNRIRSIDRCLLVHARRLDFVNLRENPFNCDCSLFWLRGLRASVMSRWTDRRTSVPFVPGKCWTPVELRGVSVTNWLNLECVRSSNKTSQHNNNSVGDDGGGVGGGDGLDTNLCNKV